MNIRMLSLLCGVALAGCTAENAGAPEDTATSRDALTSRTQVSCQGSSCYDWLSFVRTVNVSSARLERNLRQLHEDLAGDPNLVINVDVDPDGSVNGRTERTDGSNRGTEYDRGTGRVDWTQGGYLNPTPWSYNQYRYNGPWDLVCQKKNCSVE